MKQDRLMTDSRDRRVRLGIVCVAAPVLSETFISAHIDCLPTEVVVHDWWRPQVGSRQVLSWAALGMYRLGRALFKEGLVARQTTAAHVKVFRHHRVNVVMAEYGTTAVHTLPACRRLGIPLVAHFHGYDASNRAVLEEYGSAYADLFQHAAAIVAVSRAMQRKLIALGAHPDKVHYNPCGVDCLKFAGANPATASPTLVAVGRFIDKKAPHLAIRAFAKAFERCPEARLRMIGEGPLLDACVDLAQELGVAEAVTFLGPQSPTVVMEEMRRARAFVQHSIEAPSGDCEGTPVAVLEAGASGLPVVSTRHGGIPDVVLDRTTGLLVDECDVEGMAAQMVRVLTEPRLAAQLGEAARRRMETCFSIEQSMKRLADIVDACAKTESIPRTGAVNRPGILADDSVARANRRPFRSPATDSPRVAR